jgi:hypothetical protein
MGPTLYKCICVIYITNIQKYGRKEGYKNTQRVKDEKKDGKGLIYEITSITAVYLKQKRT